MNLKLKTDKNGNSIVRIQIPGKHGFSIQTNGNLPKTHRTRETDAAEIIAWVKRYGTHYQKEVING